MIYEMRSLRRVLLLLPWESSAIPLKVFFLIFTKFEFERKFFVLAYQAVLHRIHAHLVAKEDDVDGCEALHCVVHRKFAMNIIEQNRCDRCEATGFCQNIFNVSTVIVSNYHLYIKSVASVFD